MSAERRVWLKIAAALVAAAVVLGAYAAIAYLLDPHVYPGIGLVGFIWVFALTLGIIYGVISYRMTGEFGWKQFLKLLTHLFFGWLRHWRLVVALVFITAGLVAIGASPRFYVYEQVTGYRYLLGKEYAYVVDFVSGQFVTKQVLTDFEPWHNRFVKEWITYVEALKVTTTPVLKDVYLIEIPVKTPVQVWYLEMGFVLLGLTFIIVGLIFGTYHVVLANNRLMQQCGEHTARFHVNLLRLAGWEVPEGYEEALAKFYKTGDASDLRRF